MATATVCDNCGTHTKSMGWHDRPWWKVQQVGVLTVGTVADDGVYHLCSEECLAEWPARLVPDGPKRFTERPHVRSR